MYEACCSEKVYLMEVGGKCKYLIFNDYFWFTVKEENGSGNGVKAENGDRGEIEGQNGESIDEKGDNKEKAEVKEEVL